MDRSRGSSIATLRKPSEQWVATRKAWGATFLTSERGTRWKLLLRGALRLCEELNAGVHVSAWFREGSFVKLGASGV